MEAWALTRPLLSDPFSHIFATVAGWSRPPSESEFSTWVLMDFERLMQRKKNAPAFKPLPRPWEQPPAEPRGPSRSRAEKEAGRALLMQKLGLEPPEQSNT